MKKIIAKLFSRLFGYIYLEKADCLIPSWKQDDTRALSQEDNLMICMSWFDEATGELTKDVEEYALLSSFQEYLEDKLHRTALLQKGILSPDSSMQDYYDRKDCTSSPF